MGGEVGGRDQVVVNVKVGLAAAPLQVKEIEGVICSFFECMAVPFLVVVAAGCSEELVEISWLLAGDADFAGLEIDVDFCSVMDAAGVADQDAVDVDPYIVIAGEFELHGHVDA